METVIAAAFVLLPSAPIVLVYLIGIIMALKNTSRYRRAAMLALTGFVGLLAGAVIRAGATVMTLPYFRSNLSIQDVATRLAAISILGTLLAFAGTVLVLLAIFADREKKQL